MTWVCRSLCLFCLAAYWIAYSHLISWRLPFTGLVVFALAWALPNAGVRIVIAAYPLLLYLNQYPQQEFSAAAFLVTALVLALSLVRRPAHLWIPLSIVAFYFL